MLNLRPININEINLIYEWRNHPHIRQYANDPKEIDLTQHRIWVQHTLQDSNKHLLMIELQQIACGVLRLDVDEPIATVSIYLNPQSVGKGIGRLTLLALPQWIQQQKPIIQELHAVIKPDNLASIKAFTAAGYTQENHIYIKKLEHNHEHS